MIGAAAVAGLCMADWFGPVSQTVSATDLHADAAAEWPGAVFKDLVTKLMKTGFGKPPPRWIAQGCSGRDAGGIGSG